MDKDRTTQYHLRMSRENHSKVKREAAAQDRSRNWIINDAIARYNKGDKK